jgi:hypothetical protein
MSKTKKSCGRFAKSMGIRSKIHSMTSPIPASPKSDDLTVGSKYKIFIVALRELHALLKAKDPGFDGLVRVMNKRNEFLWVHERFAGEY